MYVPRAFAAPSEAAVDALIAAHPLAVLVHDLDADHVPLLFDRAARVLRGHVARANPLWREADGREVLAVFRGPEAYVTPSWYPSKAERGEVVPTWNYAVVHVRGTLHARTGRAVEDPAWLLRLVTDLTAHQEAAREAPWAVSDAPPAFVEGLLRAIVGIEIAVSGIVGKWKTSQNREPTDRDGVAEGLGDHPMAALVRR